MTFQSKKVPAELKLMVPAELKLKVPVELKLKVPVELKTQLMAFKCQKGPSRTKGITNGILVQKGPSETKINGPSRT